MIQLNQENFGIDKRCMSMTMIDVGPDSTTKAVAMCACNTSNCNLGPTSRHDVDMIGAMMPHTEMADGLPLTGMLINQDLSITFDAL